MLLHTDAAHSKGHALHLEPEPLLLALIGGQSDPATGTHYPVPRQSVLSLERPHGQACSARMPPGCRHLAVRGYPPPRYARYHLA